MVDGRFRIQRFNEILKVGSISQTQRLLGPDSFMVDKLSLGGIVFFYVFFYFYLFKILINLIGGS